MVRILQMASSLRSSLSYYRFFSNTHFGVSLLSSSRPLATSLQLSNELHLFGVRAFRLAREVSDLSINASGNAAQASTSAGLEWVKKYHRRMLRVVYRVRDVDRTIKFYTDCLGMKLLGKCDVPEGRSTTAFLGYGPEGSHIVIELTHNYGSDTFDVGDGHFGVAVEDVAKTVELVKAQGGKVTREHGPVKGGNTVGASFEDPDGHKFEVRRRGPTPEPLCQVKLSVGDLDQYVEFYKKAYGLDVLRTQDYPQYKYAMAMLGYGHEGKNAVMELTYYYGYKVATGTTQSQGGKSTRGIGPVPNKLTACHDTDGWKLVSSTVYGRMMRSCLRTVNHFAKDPRYHRKMKTKRIDLPSHYSEVNYKTLQAVVFYGPLADHIPHGISKNKLDLLQAKLGFFPRK